MGSAQRPLIVVGGGAQGAGQHVQAIAEMLDAPVMTGRMGQGVIDGRHRLSVTMPAGYRFWGEADVVLAVGTRLQPQQQNWGMDDALKIIRIDVDSEELDRQRRPEIGIVGDATATLKVLAAKLGRHNAKRNGRAGEVAETKAAAMKIVRDTLAPQIAYLEAIRKALPEDGILVDELTQMGYVARLAYPTYKPRTFLSPGYQGTLGWGYATSLGVKVARPDTPVVSISGDGGFLFTAMEMATAAQHGIGVVAVVFSDGAYGNVKRIQQQAFNNRTIASDLRNPDFVKLGESFGLAAERVKSPEELGAAISRGIARGGPMLIDCPVGELPDPWSLVPCRAIAGGKRSGLLSSASYCTRIRLDHIRIGIAAEARPGRHREAALHRRHQLAVEARLEIHVVALDHAVRRAARGHQLQGGQEARAEIGRVRHQGDAGGIGQGRHFQEFGDAAHLGDAGLGIVDGVGGEHVAELEGRAVVLARRHRHAGAGAQPGDRWRNPRAGRSAPRANGDRRAAASSSCGAPARASTGSWCRP